MAHLRWCALALACCIWAGTAIAETPKPAAQQKNPAPSSQEPAQDAPSIQVPEPNFDFGEVMEGMEIEHQYLIRNSGKGQLNIEQVRPG